MSQQFTITYEVTPESKWPDNSSGLLASIEAAQQEGDELEVGAMVLQAAHANRLGVVGVKRVEA
jgi:hypothetical protein